jgi:hypothetical protein
LENEFGEGVYLTDDLMTALLYAQQNGVILIFEWMVDQLCTHDLDGDEWQRTVKGHICFDIEGKPAPPIFYNLDMLIGPMSKNYDEIRACKQPVASPVMQYVAISQHAFDVLTGKLVAIIYLQ